MSRREIVMKYLTITRLSIMLVKLRVIDHEMARKLINAADFAALKEVVRETESNIEHDKDNSFIFTGHKLYPDDSV